jgi:hypothetical protein
VRSQQGGRPFNNTSNPTRAVLRRGAFCEEQKRERVGNRKEGVVNQRRSAKRERSSRKGVGMNVMKRSVVKQNAVTNRPLPLPPTLRARPRQRCLPTVPERKKGGQLMADISEKTMKGGTYFCSSHSLRNRKTEGWVHQQRSAKSERELSEKLTCCPAGRLGNEEAANVMS